VWHFLLLASLATSISGALWQSGWRWMEFLDNIALDAGFNLRGEVDARAVAHDLPQTRGFLLVELDHPLPRPILTELLKKLRLARVVALDLMLPDQEKALSESETSLPAYRAEVARWNRDNRGLAAQIKKSNNVAIAAWPENVRDEAAARRGVLRTQIGWVRPAPAIWNAARWHAHVRVEPDAQDGLVRRVSPWQNIAAQKSIRPSFGGHPEFVPTLGLVAAAASDSLSIKQIEQSRGAGILRFGKRKIALAADGTMLVDYLGGRRSFEGDENRVMAGRVLEGYEPEDFKGMTVFVGETDMAAKDTFPIAFGDVPGVHIHAAVAATLRSAQGPPGVLPLPLILAIALGASLFLVVPLLRLPLWSCLLLGIVEIALIFGAAALLFVRGHLVLPPSVPIAAIALTYNGVALYQYARTRATLGRFIGREMLGAALHPLDDLRLGGRTEMATAFFCDLRGYSTFAEHLAPERASRILNSYTQVLVAAVAPFGGRPIDYLGDGVFILFQGARRGKADDPRAGDHALRAVRAALAAQTALRQWQSNESVSLHAAIAIHCGEMMIGVIGADDNLKLGAIGDAVNVAARVQSLSDRCGYGVLITREVLSRIEGKIAAQRCGDFEVKGRAQAVEVFGVGEKTEAGDAKPLFDEPI